MPPPRLRAALLEVLAVALPAAVVLLGDPAFAWSPVAGLLACAAVPLRHRSPLAALVGVLPGLAGGLGWAPSLVVLYALGRRAPSFSAVAPWLVLPLVATVGPVVATQTLRWQQIVLTVGFVVVNVVAPVVVGLLVGTRTRLEQSLVELDRARESAAAAQADAARSGERARIGREIHDAVGHHITLIAVGAAALAASTREEATRAGAEELRALAKRSLGEVRSALGLAGGPVAGGPEGLDDLARLVDEWRSAGLAVDLRDGPTDGDSTVCPVVGRAAYRVVQEALTNAARHAAGAAVVVTVGRLPDRLDVRVRNGPGHRPALVGRGGAGLPGLAERVASVGGRFDAGPDAEGGFAVDASFPREPLPVGTPESDLR